MAPSSANGAQPRDPEPQPGAQPGPQTGGGSSGSAGPEAAADPTAGGVANPAAVPSPAADDAAISTAELLELLGADRLWLLQQIDAGHWPDLRLDLAALERELGQLLDQAAERLPC
ncbi:hypothetical protein [Vulcanococcus limneticus]|uniref:hypothetical protein n=1 Tax=Vulcanococcus limneticus TaxID=2170428 RepID=UPI00398C04EA